MNVKRNTNGIVKKLIPIDKNSVTKKFNQFSLNLFIKKKKNGKSFI